MDWDAYDSDTTDNEIKFRRGRPLRNVVLIFLCVGVVLVWAWAWVSTWGPEPQARPVACAQWDVRAVHAHLADPSDIVEVPAGWEPIQANGKFGDKLLVIRRCRSTP